MGRGVFFLFSLFSFLVRGAVAQAAPEEFQRICTITTDAEKGLVCTMDVVVEPTSGRALSLKIDCGQPDPSHKSFTAEQLRAGVPLVHKDDKNIDVIQLSIPDFDPIHGGTVKLHYLTNYLGKVYADWYAEVHGDAGKWTLYTSSAEGHRPFNALFAAKRTKLGITVGIKEFRTDVFEGPARTALAD